ncbi:hypothetical protein CAPTEDRAFT_129035 [Capitella teleta]|uniref:Fucosyltransferase n=1 Tax=Capitella teleta TaxID=283909 RepID=R7UL00_CAPTE|nr:hypothetical protein CAPTEDRAFT_129035 [Capitella teleta]|eukprot:ELU03917.1 hypothetical protein CAPTEDRAFT_129035 [Capitella teleta]
MKCEWRFSSGDSYLTSGDAVIFRPFAIHHGYLPPKYHPPNQKWIFQEHEAPSRTWNKHRTEMSFWSSFNVSISFVHEADIVHSENAFQCSFDPEFKPSLRPDFVYIRNKTGTILWVVSNCHFTSGREDYVNEMKKFINIDIYGSCGKGRICGGYSAYHGHNCTKQFINRYKFYLAFENSFCNNYYTEKLTKTIGVDTIPVVMGLVNYSSLLMPGTFIDVRDFSSVNALTDHLNYLDQNYTAYNEIIERKRSAKCVKSYTRPYFCELCHHLHINKYRRQTIADPRVWWGTDRQCRSKDAFFKGIR